LNMRERLAVQLKRLPEADRWRIFMMQQHMLVSHIETLESIFDKQLAPLFLHPFVKLGVSDSYASSEQRKITLTFKDDDSFYNALKWMRGQLTVEIPQAPSLRLSVKTHKLDLTSKPSGMKEVKS